MSVTTAGYIHSLHDTARLQGDKRVAADYSFQIDGYEDKWLYCKAQFWPVLSASEGIEVATPLGGAMWQPSQTKFNQQAQLVFEETHAGDINVLLNNVLQCRVADSSRMGDGAARFSAWVYYGTPDVWRERARIWDCFMTVEPVETDWENRTQIITIPATLFYHFYGEYEQNATPRALCGEKASYSFGAGEPKALVYNSAA